MIETMRNRARNASLGWRCRNSLIGAVAAMCLAGQRAERWGKMRVLLQMSAGRGPSQVPLTLENSSFMYQKLSAGRRAARIESERHHHGAGGLQFDDGQRRQYRQS